MTLNTYNNQSPDLQMQAGAFWIIYGRADGKQDFTIDEKNRLGRMISIQIIKILHTLFKDSLALNV